MAISLGGVDLPDLVISGEFSEPQVRSVVEFSLGGKPIVWEDIAYGTAMDLVGTEEEGWITRATLFQLKALSAVPQSSYDLSYEGAVYTVRFRNEDPPVISAEPIVPRPNQEDADFYKNVVLKLMRI